MMKTTTKVAVETAPKKEMKEAFALWRKESQKGTYYLTGYAMVGENKVNLVAYFNTNKKNPKEPDVRVYESIKNADGTYSTSEKEVASLWDEITKNEKRILKGSTNDGERLVGFYGLEHQEARPYIRAYYDEK